MAAEAVWLRDKPARGQARPAGLPLAQVLPSTTAQTRRAPARWAPAGRALGRADQNPPISVGGGRPEAGLTHVFLRTCALCSSGEPSQLR